LVVMICSLLHKKKAKRYPHTCRLWEVGTVPRAFEKAL
jgi:hypothetical protein